MIRTAPVVLLVGACCARAADVADPAPTLRLQARVLAVGLPGVGGVRQIGRFHSGGPIPGNPEFLLQTDPGRTLDPQRLLVAVASNFGAPLGNVGHAAGSVLSIDPRTDYTLVVPDRFAASGGQAQAAGGAIRLYTGQSRAFQNRRHNGTARTAEHAAASGPRYLSVNNGFGRPWIANAPLGPHGDGSLSVVDPDGTPLDNAPSDQAGGVFAGRSTNRERAPKGHASGLIARALNYRASPQLTAGALAQGVLGTALLGPSPDGSGFAVFAAVTADGAVAQVHVQDGVDGLAPAGTVSAGNDPLGVIGVALKWNPERVIYVADAGRDRLVLLHLQDDGRHFKLSRSSTIESPALRQPVDVAAAVPEIANPRFASHTTLAGGSDLYVANRGDGSIVRIDARGRLLARAEIVLPGLGKLPGDRLRALAVSGDAQRLWLTLQGEVPGFAGREGALIEVAAFDRGGAFAQEAAQPKVAPDTASAHAGAQAFARTFTPESGLGPLFNASSCVDCHPGPGGMSTSEEHFARRVARMDPASGRVSAIDAPNSPLARRHSTRELGRVDAAPALVPRQANVTSLRMPLSLYPVAGLDGIADAAIVAQAVSKGDGINGRVHYVVSRGGEQRAGRYGWKADIATLDEMVAEALAQEIGITSALATTPVSTPKDDGSLVRALTAYLRTLRLPKAAR